MKRQLLIITGLITILLTPRCSSMDTEAVKSMDEVAVAIMGADKHVDMGDYSGISTMIQKLANNDDFDLTPIVDKLHKKTFREYGSTMPFQLMGEDKVLSTESYKNYQALEKDKHDQRLKKNSNVITPEGYHNYNPQFLNKKHITKLVKAVPSEADGMMLIYVTYSMKKHDVPMVPYSNASIMANIHLEVYDNEANKVMNIKKKGESDEKIKVVVGAMLDIEKVQPMCKTATDKAFEKVDAFIQNELAS